MQRLPIMNTVKFFELLLTSPEVPCPKNIVYMLFTKKCYYIKILLLKYVWLNSWNSLELSIKFITVFYLLAYKCVSHENFIAEAFYKLGSSESIEKDKRAVLLPTTAFGDLSARLFFI